MKKIITFTTFAVTGFLVYWLINNKKSGEGLSEVRDRHSQKEHHITNVFSKAKQYASDK